MKLHPHLVGIDGFDDDGLLDKGLIGVVQIEANLQSITRAQLSGIGAGKFHAGLGEILHHHRPPDVSGGHHVARVTRLGKIAFQSCSKLSIDRYTQFLG